MDSVIESKRPWLVIAASTTLTFVSIWVLWLLASIPVGCTVVYPALVDCGTGRHTAAVTGTIVLGVLLLGVIVSAGLVSPAHRTGVTNLFAALIGVVAIVMIVVTLFAGGLLTV